MEYLVGSRVALTPRPVRRREAAFEVAMLGHCPGGMRLERLLEMPAALDAMRTAGYGPSVDALLQGSKTDLYHLPIPLHSNAEFSDIFPDAHREKTQYVGVLAGGGAWLPQAIEDFFANGGEKLWAVQIPQAEGQDGFLPSGDTVLHDVDSLRGVATVLVIGGVAAVAMPDLERLQIPARLPDIPRNRLENQAPRFLPCSQRVDDRHRERRYPHELPDAPATRPMDALLRSILGIVARYRPDLTILFTLPLDYSGELGGPVADAGALQWLDQMRNIGGGRGLRHMQFFFPYLRGPRFSLRSPVGLVAGLQAAVARRAGPWRSMAAQPMITDALPYPRQSLAQTRELREDPGVGVLQVKNGRMNLDDERLVVPALHPADHADAIDRERFDSYRSAELGRFLGFLRRQLQALGEALVFNADYRDPRPRLAIEQFLRRLHALGALRGALPEDAFQISESHTREGTLIYEIMVAPAFPIDRLYLTFVNRSGAWQTEVAGV
jgi:hypothetical protein